METRVALIGIIVEFFKNDFLKSYPECDFSIIENLIDGEEKTLEEVGNIFGISRERVRQLEAKALNELRKPKNAKELKRVKN